MSSLAFILSLRVIYAINVRQLKYMQHLMLPNKSKSHLKYQMPLTKLLNGVFLEDFEINNLILIHVYYWNS